MGLELVVVLYQMFEVLKPQDQLYFQVLTGSIDVSGSLIFCVSDATNSDNGNTSLITASTLSCVGYFIIF